MDEKTVKFTLKRKIKLEKLKQDVKKARRYFQNDDEENNKPIFLLRNPLHTGDSFKHPVKI